MSQFNANQFFSRLAYGGGGFGPFGDVGSPQTFPYPGSNQPSGSSGGSPNAPRPVGPNLRDAQRDVDRAMNQFRGMTQSQNGWRPYTDSMRYGAPNADYNRRSSVPGTGTGGVRPNYRSQMNDAAWNALFTNAVFGDMQTQQGIMDEQFNRLNQGMSNYEQAFTQGADRMRDIAQQQRASIGAKADQAMQMGQQGYGDFIKYRDQQLAAVGKDITAANEQAAGAVESYEKTIGQYKDRTALQAQDLAVGLQRQVQNTMNDIATGMNPDGTMMDPAQKAALMTTMQQNTAQQTSLGINEIYTKFNDTMASMGANLASLKQAQSQTTLAGGQLRGQVGTAFGAQTIDAQRMRGSMMELSANLTTTMEQMSAASELGAINLLTQGYKDMYDMIQGNKRGTTSMFAALSGWLAGMTTPGLTQIAPPNFRNL
jgi:hypothetical protein